MYFEIEVGETFRNHSSSGMGQSSEGRTKKISSVNIDKLIKVLSQIEKKMIKTNGKNNILEIQLEKIVY